MSRIRGFSKKKRRFLQFSIAPPTKFSNGCQSDNFDPRRSAHGSSKSLCPNFFETHVRCSQSLKLWVLDLSKVRWSKNLALKIAVFRHFLRKNALSRPNRPFWPQSVIHILKPVHLSNKMSYLEAVLVHPVSSLWRVLATLLYSGFFSLLVPYSKILLLGRVASNDIESSNASKLDVDNQPVAWSCFI